MTDINNSNEDLKINDYHLQLNFIQYNDSEQAKMIETYTDKLKEGLIKLLRLNYFYVSQVGNIFQELNIPIDESEVLELASDDTHKSQIKDFKRDAKEALTILLMLNGIECELGVSLFNIVENRTKQTPDNNIYSDIVQLIFEKRISVEVAVLTLKKLGWDLNDEDQKFLITTRLGYPIQ